MGRRLLGLGVTLLLGACAKEAAAPLPSDAMERSARILARLDQLEADLHDEGSKLAVYGELEQRHGQTSQIACQVSDEHLQEIHRLATAQEKLAEDLDQVEEAMTGLQVLYEKYFLGIDRRPPDAQRRQVSETMRVLKTTTVKNTALKFRIQTLFAKLISFERMWDRTLREIEEGTYKRDVYKAKLRDARRGKGEQKPAQAAAASSQLSEQMIRKLYDTYLVARQRTGESIAGITYEGIASRIRAQVPDLMARHKARNIEFKVVIKGGKAILKAIPQT